jgi:hypothetical protein
VSALLRALHTLWLRHERAHLRASIEYEEEHHATHPARMLLWRRELALLSSRIDRNERRANTSRLLSGLKSHH